MLEIERLNSQNMSGFNVKNLQEKCHLLTQGIKLMKKISELVKWITNLHADERRPMVVSVLLALCRLVEVLKSFQFIFHRNILSLVYISLLVCQQLTHKLLTLLHSLKVSCVKISLKYCLMNIILEKFYTRKVIQRATLGCLICFNTSRASIKGTEHISTNTDFQASFVIQWTFL